jgi:hypothetical protein
MQRIDQNRNVLEFIIEVDPTALENTLENYRSGMNGLADAYIERIRLANRDAIAEFESKIRRTALLWLFSIFIGGLTGVALANFLFG